MLITKIQKEWEEAEHSFAGWIPNVSGRISFSLAGQLGTTHTRYSTDLIPEPKHRWLALEQVRNNLDFPLPATLTRIFSPTTSQIWHLTGRTFETSYPTSLEGLENPIDNSQGGLHGHLFLFVRQANTRKRLVQSAIRKRLWKKDIAHNSNLIEAMLRKKDLIVPEFRYAIFRSGELRLWIEDSTLELIKSNIDEEADDDQNDINSITQLLTDQAFFFLKDMFHNHAHHIPSADQLIPICRTSPIASSSSTEATEIGWRREILWSLTRVIKEFGRKRGLSRLKRIPGLIAYADAFQNTMAKYYRRPNTEDECFAAVTTIHYYNFIHIGESIQSQISVIETIRSRTGQLLAFLAATFVGFISVMNTTTSALNSATPEGQSPQHKVLWDETAIDRILSNPEAAVTLSLFFIASIYIIATKPFEIPIIQFLQRNISRLVYVVNITTMNLIRQTLGPLLSVIKLDWLIDWKVAYYTTAASLTYLSWQFVSLSIDSDWVARDIISFFKRAYNLLTSVF